MSLRRVCTVSTSNSVRAVAAVRYGGSGHGAAHHAAEEHHGDEHVAAGSHGHGHGHGHGHHHHHHEQKLLTKLPLGPKYPGGKKWGLFVGVEEDPTTFGRVCLCFMSVYIFFVYYYHTGF